MPEIRMVGAVGGKLGSVWNPRPGDVIETTAENAALLVRQGMAVLVGGDVETRTADEAPAPKPAKKKATTRRKRGGSS